MGGSRSWSLGSLEGAQKKPVSLTMIMVFLLQNYSRESTSGGKASEVSFLLLTDIMLDLSNLIFQQIITSCPFDLILIILPG